MTQPSLPQPRYIYVKRVEQCSAHLKRMYFYCDDISDLSPIQNGGHIKLFFPKNAELKPELPYKNQLGKVVWDSEEKPVIRTYTLSQVLEKDKLLVIDFVLHPDFGIASDWAAHAQAGHVLGLAGPGGPERFNMQANYWVFIGDLSTFAMISASLEQLHAHAHGEVWIEIEDRADQIQFNHPQAMQINWIMKDHHTESQIINSLSRLDWASNQISVTLAGEHMRVVSLRNLLKNQFKFPKSNLYAVPYWKQSENEESYHAERHCVMDE